MIIKRKRRRTRKQARLESKEDEAVCWAGREQRGDAALRFYLQIFDPLSGEGPTTSEKNRGSAGSHREERYMCGWVVGGIALLGPRVGLRKEIGTLLDYAIRNPPKMREPVAQQ